MIGPVLLIALVVIGVPLLLIAALIDGVFFAPRRKRAAKARVAARSCLLSSTTDPEVWIRTFVDEQKFAPTVRSDGDRFLISYASAMTDRSFNEVTKQIVPAVLDRFPQFHSIEVI